MELPKKSLSKLPTLLLPHPHLLPPTPPVLAELYALLDGALARCWSALKAIPSPKAKTSQKFMFTDYLHVEYCTFLLVMVIFFYNLNLIIGGLYCMTDNEKRAHDLAIATVSGLMNPDFLKTQASLHEDKIVTFDPYVHYMKAYRLLLESFEKDFPDGN